MHLAIICVMKIGDYFQIPEPLLDMDKANDNIICYRKLEQLEPPRSEDAPRRLMITHTIESYWIPSKKAKN